MKKLIITEKEVVEFLLSNEILYASETISNKRLDIKYKGFGELIVTYGEDILYNGYDLSTAVKAFNFPENFLSSE